MNLSPPSAKNKGDSKNCVRCNEEFWIFTKKINCYYCGYLFCRPCIDPEKQTLPEYNLNIPVSLCTYCGQIIKMSKMTEDELKTLSIKELKGYLKVFGISANNLLEKTEFVKLISKFKISQQNVDNYSSNVLPLIKLEYQTAKQTNSQNSRDNNPLHFMKDVLEDLKEPVTHSERSPNSNTSNPDLNPLNFFKKVFDGPKDTPTGENRRASNPFTEIIDGISSILKPNEREDQAQSRPSDTFSSQQSNHNQFESAFNSNTPNQESNNQQHSQRDQPPLFNDQRQESQSRFSSTRRDSVHSNINSQRESFHRPDIEISQPRNDLPHHEHSFSTPSRPSLSSHNIDIPRPRSRSTDNLPSFEFSPRESAPYSSSYTPSTGTPTRIAETPTIRQIIANKINLESLSTKALRQILLLERVSLKFALERKDLLERVQLLIDNVRKEQGNLPEDQICKICCDLAINCVLLECGHLIACMECASELQKTTDISQTQLLKADLETIKSNSQVTIDTDVKQDLQKKDSGCELNYKRVVFNETVISHPYEEWEDRLAFFKQQKMERSVYYRLKSIFSRK
ncbi:hypothetical protein HDV06_003327 [Boothiomyces sp. JEL0866]|nr:hypothetical protein HDV06_003327 [Boothiomyces sp. JEL0866]